MNRKYELYLFICNANGDIWNSQYYPLSYEQWVEAGRPTHQGTNNEYCNKY